MTWVLTMSSYPIFTSATRTCIVNEQKQKELAELDDPIDQGKIMVRKNKKGLKPETQQRAAHPQILTLHEEACPTV